MTHGVCAYIHPIYIPPLYGTHRVEESNLAACIFENTPKGTLLPFGITAKFRAIRHLQLLMLLLEHANPQTHRYPVETT